MKFFIILLVIVILTITKVTSIRHVKYDGPSFTKKVGSMKSSLPFGRPVPQILAEKAAKGQDIRLSGDFWWPMDLQHKLTKESTLLFVIDMQPLFYDSRSPWGASKGLSGSPMNEIYPRIEKLATSFAEFTANFENVIFTRFIPAENTESAPGVLKTYYSEHHQKAATQEVMRKNGVDVEYMLDIMPEMKHIVEKGAKVFDKISAGVWSRTSKLPAYVKEHFQHTKTIDTIIITGVETDYCVLATIIGCIDNDIRVILVKDAVGSSQPNSAQAQFDYTFNRFMEFIEIVTVDELIQKFHQASQ